MRVLLLSDFYPPVRGGLEFHVDALAAELVARGHAVTVATLSPEAMPTDDRVVVHTMRTGIWQRLPHADESRPFHPPLPDPHLRRALRELALQFRPDVIHGHSWMTASLPHLKEVPLVFTAHDYGLVCQRRSMVRRGGVACSGPGVYCLPCGAEQYGRATSALLAPGTALGRRLMNFTEVIAVSTPVADVLRARVQAPVTVLPNFLARSALEGADTQVDAPSGRFVMYAGDPGEHKGIGVLLDAWRRLDRSDAELLLATTRPYEGAVPPGVAMRQWGRAQVLGAWRQAALAVVPSKWPDPFPTSAIEAMASGTPVVASRTGGLIEMIRDGVDGCLVPPSDPAALATAIGHLLDDDALRNRLGRSARERAQLFSAESVVGRICELYDRVVAAMPQP